MLMLMLVVASPATDCDENVPRCPCSFHVHSMSHYARLIACRGHQLNQYAGMNHSSGNSSDYLTLIIGVHAISKHRWIENLSKSSFIPGSLPSPLRCTLFYSTLPSLHNITQHYTGSGHFPILFTTAISPPLKPQSRSLRHSFHSLRGR